MEGWDRRGGGGSREMRGRSPPRRRDDWERERERDFRRRGDEYGPPRGGDRGGRRRSFDRGYGDRDRDRDRDRDGRDRDRDGRDGGRGVRIKTYKQVRAGATTQPLPCTARPARAARCCAIGAKPSAGRSPRPLPRAWC